MSFIKSTGIAVCLLILCIPHSLVGQQGSSPSYSKADVIVYGGTSGAVTAAVQAAKMGKTVIMVSPDLHLGGLSSGGLGFTDVGNKAVIGGLSREFYHRVYLHYQHSSSWQWQDHADFGKLRGQSTAAVDKDRATMWIFELHVAEKIFNTLVSDYEVTVLRDEWLDRKNGVAMGNGHFSSLKTLSGKTFHGEMFIDGTYEGDLMAAAGVDYHVGREANSVYNENWNGVQTGIYHPNHFFPPDGPYVDPDYAPGEPSSGIIPRISTKPPGEKGSGEKKIQAYCFRMCLSSHPDNMVPFPMLDSYDASQYLGLL